MMRISTEDDIKNEYTKYYVDSILRNISVSEKISDESYNNICHIIDEIYQDGFSDGANN
jgi:hypothetical protein